MDCRECGATGATEVEVAFTDGVRREILLCADCRDEYSDGDFVDGVERE